MKYPKILALFLMLFCVFTVSDQYALAPTAEAGTLPKGAHSPFYVWTTSSSPALEVEQEQAVNASVDYVLAIIDAMGTTAIGQRKAIAVKERGEFEAAYKVANPTAIAPVKGAHSPFKSWPVGTNQLLLAQESFRLASVDYGYAVIDQLSSTKVASKRTLVQPARDAFEMAYEASQIPAFPDLPPVAPWTVAADWESLRLIAQDQYQAAATKYFEAILLGKTAAEISAAKGVAVAARANLIAVAGTEPLPDLTEIPTLGDLYELPYETNVFTAAQAEYARRCVDLVEGMQLGFAGLGREPINYGYEFDFFEAMLARSVLMGVTDGKEITADVTTVMPAATIPLVRGTAAALKPVPEPVAGRALAPVFTGVETYDDAADTFSPAPIALAWDGEDEFVPSFFESTADGPVPMHMEFSLDGGPWVSARYGKITVPDQGEGDYQIRMVLFPTNGTTSIPLEPLVVKRTVKSDGTTPLWWVLPPYGFEYRPPPVVTFSAAPLTITSGGTSTLTWTTTGATSVSIDQGIGPVALNGSMTVTPTGARTYTLTALGAGQKAASVTISVSIPAGVEPPIPAGATVMTLGTSPVTIAGNGTASGVANPAAVSVTGHTMIPWDGTSRGSPAVQYGNTLLALNLWANTPTGPVPEQIEASLNGGPWAAERGTIYVPNGLPDGTYQVRIVSWPAAGNSSPWQPLYIRRTTAAGGQVQWSWYQ